MGVRRDLCPPPRQDLPALGARHRVDQGSAVKGMTLNMQRAARLFRWVCTAAVFVGLVAFFPDGIEDDVDAPTVRLLISLSRGTLVICGGGEISDEVLNEFVDAAGGEAARVVVITTATETADSDEIVEEMEFLRAPTL